MPRFSLLQRLKSFLHAFRGIRVLIAPQHNARIHAVATVIVVALGFILNIGKTDWALLAVAIGMVWMAEAFNTAIEHLADEVSLEHRERIGKAKDLAAAGVLIASLCAAAIGMVVFIPRFF